VRYDLREPPPPFTERTAAPLVLLRTGACSLLTAQSYDHLHRQQPTPDGNPQDSPRAAVPDGLTDLRGRLHRLPVDRLDMVSRFEPGPFRGAVVYPAPHTPAGLARSSS